MAKKIKKVVSNTVFVLLIIFMNWNTTYTQPSGSKIMQKYFKSVDKAVGYSKTIVSSTGKIMKAPVLNGKINVVDIPDYKVAPESFNNDSAGNLYICDTIGRKVEVFNSAGDYKATIQLNEDVLPTDVAIDDENNVFIYDELKNKLGQYDNKGNLIASIDVNPDRWQDKAHGPLMITNNNIYFTTSSQEDVVIGKIYKGKLISLPLDEQLKPLKQGTVAKSGRRYLVDLVWKEKGKVDIIDQADSIIKSTEFTLDGILSLKFLGEDDSGNFYVQTERVGAEPEIVILEVYKFDTTGEIIGIIPIPDNKYYFLTIKLLSIDKTGNIYQFLPTIDKGKIYVFKQE